VISYEFQNSKEKKFASICILGIDLFVFFVHEMDMEVDKVLQWLDWDLIILKAHQRFYVFFGNIDKPLHIMEGSNIEVVW
jgi:hypothetical protein